MEYKPKTAFQIEMLDMNQRLQAQQSAARQAQMAAQMTDVAGLRQYRMVDGRIQNVADAMQQAYQQLEMTRQRNDAEFARRLAARTIPPARSYAEIYGEELAEVMLETDRLKEKWL